MIKTIKKILTQTTYLRTWKNHWSHLVNKHKILMNRAKLIEKFLTIKNNRKMRIIFFQQKKKIKAH